MSEELMRLAQRWFIDLWSEGKLEVADEIVAPDYAPDWVQIDAIGPAQVKREVTYFRSIFPDLRYEIQDTAVTENRIWVRYLGRGTQLGNAWGFAPTGRVVTYDGATILTMNDAGQIADRWGAFCMYDILADLGLTPPYWELSEHLGAQDRP
jgi:hypothetical protein